MDPDANLKEQRKLAAEVLATLDPVEDASELDPEEVRMLADAALELALYVQALDEWLTNGGLLPVQWLENRAPFQASLRKLSKQTKKRR